MKKLHEAGEELYAAFQQQLGCIEETASDFIARSEAATAVCREYLSQLKSLVQQHGFADQAEEIHFFKTVKPRFLSHLIYYTVLFNFHSHWPMGGEIIQRQYIEREIARLQQYQAAHEQFLGYYQSHSDYLDKMYFVRGNDNIRLKPEAFYFEADPTFSTGYDYVLSQILANNRLIVFLENQLRLSQKTVSTSSLDASLSPIPWSYSKADLVELMYALHCGAVLKNGKADLKLIATCFEQIFQIELGNYYNIFREICMRKKNQTKFLDHLKTMLQRKIDESN